MCPSLPSALNKRENLHAEGLNASEVEMSQITNERKGWWDSGSVSNKDRFQQLCNFS